MVSLHLNSPYGLSSNVTSTQCFKQGTKLRGSYRTTNTKNLSFFYTKKMKIRAIGTVPEKDQATEATLSEQEEEEEPPSVGFAFVSSVLLPDGTPDVHLRTASGGQKLRDIMLDNDIDLYGPYARPLLNCGGGGTCGACMVEVIEGKELLSPKTDKEKEHLNKKPKNWRLACQTTVGTADSRGMNENEPSLASLASGCFPSQWVVVHEQYNFHSAGPQSSPTNLLQNSPLYSSVLLALPSLLPSTIFDIALSSGNGGDAFEGHLSAPEPPQLNQHKLGAAGFLPPKQA